MTYFSSWPQTKWCSVLGLDFFWGLHCIICGQRHAGQPAWLFKGRVLKVTICFLIVFSVSFLSVNWGKSTLWFIYLFILLAPFFLENENTFETSMLWCHKWHSVRWPQALFLSPWEHLSGPKASVSEGGWTLCFLESCRFIYLFIWPIAHETLPHWILRWNLNIWKIGWAFFDL